MFVHRFGVANRKFHPRLSAFLSEQASNLERSIVVGGQQRKSPGVAEFQQQRRSYGGSSSSSGGGSAHTKGSWWSGNSWLYFAALAGGTTSAAAEAEAPKKSDNPLWPDGIRDEDVNAFVTQILADPNMNLSAVPDAVERQIYKSTIVLVLNFVYYGLSRVHGSPILGGHELILERVYEEGGTTSSALQWKSTAGGHESETGVDEGLLEEMADKLLQNKAVNLAFLPDVLERQLYMNCLKLVFHLLDVIASSFRVQLCGHDLVISLTPTNKDNLKRRAVKVSSSMSAIDVEAVRASARRIGMSIDSDHDEHKNLSFFDRWTISEDFLAEMNATLYSLLLGLIDDILANSEIQLLSDRILFDIVPSTNPSPVDSETEESSSTDAAAAAAETKEEAAGGSAATFAMGMGVGASAMAIISMAIIASTKK